jgi:small subunit ribosomal protein S17
MAHDENNSCQVGDTVRILESKPLSRRKRWVVTEVLGRTAAD